MTGVGDGLGVEREMKEDVKDFSKASSITGQIEMPFIEMGNMGRRGDLQ